MNAPTDPGLINNADTQISDNKKRYSAGVHKSPQLGYRDYE